MSEGRRRPHTAALIGLAIIANLAGAIGYAARHRVGGEPAAHGSTPSAGAIPPPSPTAVRALLDRRSRAVLRRDRAGFLATVDPADEAFRTAQATLYDNLSKVPLASWRETLADTRPAVASEDGWTARLKLTYRLRGFDRRDLSFTEYLTFDRRPGSGWEVAGDGTAQGLRDDTQIWAGGALTAVRGRHTLVLGTGGDARALRDIGNRLDSAVGAVSAVVGERWTRRIVVLAPATEQQAEELVGDARNLGDIAALATVSGGAGSGEDRIVISPGAFGRLNALGRHVVLTHELTHVAMGGARDTHTPMWLIEGLADYIGYKEVGVPTRTAARELAQEMSAGTVPTALPGRQDFAASGTRLSSAYEGAWLACRMIAERYGEGALIRLYRAMAAEPGESGDPGIEERALRSVLRLTSGEFAAQWRAYLRKELG